MNVQGGLFDAPFMHQNHSNSSDRNNEDHVLHSSRYPETTPLRRRENDSFASPVYNNTHHYPQHHYHSEAVGGSVVGGILRSFPLGGGSQQQLFPRRRKQQTVNRFADPDRWIKIAMRAVLLSPVVVLVVWSMAALTFTHKQVILQQQHRQMASSQTSAHKHQTTKNTNKNTNNNNQHHQSKHVPNHNDNNRIHKAEDWINNHLVHPNVFGSTGDSQVENNELPLLLPVVGASEEVKNLKPVVLGGASPLIVQPQIFPPQGGGAYFSFPDEQSYSTNSQVQQQQTQKQGGSYVENTNLYNNNGMYSDQQLASQQLPNVDNNVNQYANVPYLQQQQPRPNVGNLPSGYDDIVTQQLQLLGNKNAFYDSFQPPPGYQQQQRMRLSGYVPQFITQRFQQRQQQQEQRRPVFGMSPLDQQEQMYYTQPQQVQPHPHPQVPMMNQQYSYDSSLQQQQLLHNDPNVASGQQVVPLMASDSEPEPKVVDQALLGSAMSKHHSYLRKQGNVKGDVRYYFYDPRRVSRSNDGSVHLPATVYDINGRPVSIHSLSKRSSNQIYMEPPRGSSLTYLYSNYTYNTTNITSSATLSPTYTNDTSATVENSTVSNYTWVHPNVVHTPVRDRQKGMVAISNLQVPQWGDSTSYDSSIIICTVGVMALLVGAISARRMRSRSVLSMCIENESLEDDIAYDTAYTVPAGDTNHYNTFNNQGWRGDLEKFDV